MTKAISAFILSFALAFSAGCVSVTETETGQSELDKITEIAIDTCGAKNQVESVSLDGFVCRD